MPARLRRRPGRPTRQRAAAPREEVEPSTVVSAVYPSASRLPENQLKLYLHFSAPMTRGEAYRHIRLLDAEGRALQLVFLELGEELWDPGLRRLTLFFDPGRIKRGLRPHLDAGPPLTEGTSYRLVIDPGWRDAAGLPLAAGFEKAFTVTAPDRHSPDPDSWRLTAPAAASRRFTWKLRLFRLLLESRYERHDIEALLDYVDWLMQLPAPFEQRLDEEIEKMEATKRVPYMTPWERRGVEKGLEKGLEKGRQEGLRLGKAELLKSMLSRRFGELSEDVIECIDRADIDSLDCWSSRIFDAKRLEDVFGDEDS